MTSTGRVLRRVARSVRRRSAPMVVLSTIAVAGAVAGAWHQGTSVRASRGPAARAGGDDGASLVQRGPYLHLTVEPAVRLAASGRRGPAGRNLPWRRICLYARGDLDRGTFSRACLGPRGAAAGRRSAGALPHLARGDARALTVPAASIARGSSVDWYVEVGERGCGSPDGQGCVARFPAHGTARLQMRPFAMAACSARSAGIARHGPRSGRLVALTFDDGPGPQTAAILGALRRAGVRATFFVTGAQVLRHRRAARRIVAEGHEIANHSLAHEPLPGARDIARATTIVEDATGVRPCHARPPYGAFNRSLGWRYAGAGLASVGWDRNSVDYSRPGEAAIVRRATRRLRPGSIVLLHDGPKRRRETVRALPRIVERVRSRGLEPAAISDIFGSGQSWRMTARRE